MTKDAATLNSILAAGGEVRISTMTRVTKYTKRNAGCFTDGADGLYVQHGKSKLYLGRNAALVGLQAWAAR